MRSFLVALAWLALSAQAAEPALRPSARLLFKDPDMLKAGQCVRYEEGGAGFIMTEPVFYLRGEVLASAVETRHLGHCPLVPGKNLDQYGRNSSAMRGHIPVSQWTWPSAMSRWALSGSGSLIGRPLTPKGLKMRGVSIGAILSISHSAKARRSRWKLTCLRFVGTRTPEPEVTHLCPPWRANACCG